MTRHDWLLLVLKTGRSLSPVQLQKSLFLIGKRLPGAVGDDYYNFKPHDYGPFNAEIYSDASELRQEGLVEIDNPLARGWRRYSTTEKGAARSARIAKRIGKKNLNKLEGIVSTVRGQSFSSLVRSIYEEFPEFRVNSVFKDM